MEKTGHCMPNLFDATTVPVLQERAEDWFARAELDTLLLAAPTPYGKQIKAVLLSAYSSVVAEEILRSNTRIAENHHELLDLLTTARDACCETDQPRITAVLEKLRTWENTQP